MIKWVPVGPVNIIDFFTLNNDESVATEFNATQWPPSIGDLIITTGSG